MKKHIITALLITAMISTMTACGNKNTDTPAEETVVATEATGELPTANDEKVVVGTLNKDDVATLPLTDEEKPVVDATPSPDAKSTDAPKSTTDPKTTADPKASAKPVTTATAKPSTQAANTATTKPNATTAPKSTTAPKATATPAPAATVAPKATATPVATAAPKATQTPAASTPAPTAAPVACQHTNTHVESSHDTYEIPIAGGCYEVWRTATRVCNDCGANLGENQEKVNEVHTNVVHKQGVSATCTTDGYSQVCGCDCGSQPEIGGEVIPAYGHSYHDEYVSSDVIKGDDGIPTGIVHHYQSVCYNCGDVGRTWDETEN